MASQQSAESGTGVWLSARRNPSNGRDAVCVQHLLRCSKYLLRMQEYAVAQNAPLYKRMRNMRSRLRRASQKCSELRAAGQRATDEQWEQRSARCATMQKACLVLLRAVQQSTSKVDDEFSFDHGSAQWY